MNHSSQIIQFYSGLAADNRGRFLSEILKWDHGKLEEVHDFIQWLFPLSERSAFNPYAPALTVEDMETFKNSGDLKKKLLQAFDLMLDFYGFRRNGDAIERSETFKKQSEKWLTAGNHNYLRISRILKSLCLLGLSGLAKNFLKILGEVYAENPGKIARSFSYWENAVV